MDVTPPLGPFLIGEDSSLKQILDHNKIIMVLVAGVRTEVCVDITAKRSSSEGFDTVILSDLVATYDDAKQRHELVLAEFGKYYGFVMESKSVLKSMEEG